MYSNPDEILWKTEFPPRSAIPTAPRAMINACIKNGFFGYGRPTRVSTPAYAYQSGQSDQLSDTEMTEASIPTQPANMTTTNTTTIAPLHSNIATTTNMTPNNSNNNYYYQQKYMDIQQQQQQQTLPTAPSSSYINNTYYDSPVTGSPANSVSNSVSTTNINSTTNTVTTTTNNNNTAPASSSSSTPLKLPTNWRSAYSPDGTIYYYHKITGKTQWQFPQEEERASSIEGVSNRSDLQDLVERAIHDTEQKKIAIIKRSESPQVQTPSSSRRGSSDIPRLDETELKKEIGKVVTKYLSTKKTDLWKGDKYLFKELARKVKRMMAKSRMVY
jgi:hypothetical protein